MNLSHEDPTFWPIYIIIKNWDAKTRQSQKWPGTFFLSSIPIIHEQLEDANNKNKDLKAKIYYMTLKSILQRI